MSAIFRTEEDWLEQLRALLPPGPAWDADLAPEIDMILWALAAEFARLDRRAVNLLEELDPLTMRELLVDYERVMQLPDECLGEFVTFEERRREVLRRLVGIAGQTPEWFRQLAVEHGYTNAYVIEYRAPRFGRSRFGRDRFGTWAQQFFWRLVLGARLVGGSRFGVARFGERFGGNPNSAIQCLVQRWMPAHTVVRFDYE
ncbi:putative phage tail protein [Paraburkholderia susongensis]|uniref:Uncharacterized protein YmfQ in lambdoid prophage, DUF2313 family n=1 Tax=Paraburkholderia susongensis TaxID=1515439 RepID=A0A1X7I495_9BURK|nr:putative phage tail protein [Paraburkholderia susongensis]SMG09239.1 Uncharacterized protein YmfQ in lambdoid prophage, DUF2313 family [Paraburkholderia susongensis]